MSKKISIDPIDIKSFVRFVRSYTFKISIFVLFVVFYKFTNKVFSNDYILDTILKSNIYSRECLFLHEDDPELVNKLNKFYNSIDNRYLVLPVFFKNMPTVLKDVEDIQIRKNVYIEILLPILLKVQKDALKDRSRLIEINTRMINEPLMEEDFLFIENLAKKYNVELAGDNFWDYVDAVDELLLRVDVIPNSLALAISAKETGWGVSRFLQESNSLFSQWAWDDNDGVVPLLRKKNDRHVIKRFGSLEQSVRAFYLNINTHNAYKEFRIQRRKMRLTDGTLRVRKLTSTLTKYSIEKDYTNILDNIIISNSLEGYDNYAYFSKDHKTMCLTII